MTQKYTHVDNDGDTLRVAQGLQGAVIYGTCDATLERTEVAVRTADLPALIAVLQAIHDELDDTPPKSLDQARILPDGATPGHPRHAIVSPVDLNLHTSRTMMGHLRTSKERHAGMWAYPFPSEATAQRRLQSILREVGS